MSPHVPSHIDPDVEFGHERAAHHRFALILLWWLGGLSLLLVGMALPPTREAIENLDTWWLERMVDGEVAALVTLGEILAYAGSVYVTVPVRIGVSVWLARRAEWDRLGVWLGAIVLSEGMLSILKALYGRERPPVDLALEVTRSSSFPSGHSVAATATAIALVYVFARAGSPARHWFYAAATYAIVMALSRNYLRVHWLSDVSVGMVLGSVAAMASVWVVERFTVRIGSALEATFGWAARKEG